MSNIGVVLDYISRTNLFNFIIFLSIIIFVIKKIDVKGILDNAKNEVVDSINHSEEVKLESENNLKEIEEVIAHLEEEVDGIIRKSDENAKLVGAKIIEDAHNAVETLKENARKIIGNHTALLKNDIMKRASMASVEVAKKHIISELNLNQGLHDKLIDESIDAVDGVNL